MNQRIITPSTQQGMTLILLVFIIGMAATAFLLNALNANTVKIERDKKTAAALMQAKQALISWAATQPSLTKLGQLPCPENTSLIGMPTEGTSQNTCTLPAIGRLPWRTLGLEDIRDGNGDKLWYAISTGFRSTNINSDTPAQLTVDGVAASATAIVFSPGRALAGQVRQLPTIANPPDITQYLELTNNDGDNTFVSMGAADTFNDRLLTISHDELFAVVERRVAGEALNCLNAYALNPVSGPPSPPPPIPPVGAYPWPAKLDSTAPPAYVGTVDNFFGRLPDFPMGGDWAGSCSIPVGGTGWWLNWKEMVFFALADGYKPTVATPRCSGGCLIVSPPSALADKRVVVLVAGKMLAGQVRTSFIDKGNLANYLELPNSVGISYAQQNANGGFNDVVVYR